MISTSRETGFCSAFDGGGDESMAAGDGYVTLDVDSHYFLIAGGSSATGLGIQIVTDATIAGTFTIESCMWPRDKIQGPATKYDYDETSGIWIPMDLPTATIATGHIIQTTGTGWTVTLSTMAKTAGVGGAMIYLLRPMAKRYRIKAAITTGGKVAVLAHGKAG